MALFIYKKNTLQSVLVLLCCIIYKFYSFSPYLFSNFFIFNKIKRNNIDICWLKCIHYFVLIWETDFETDEAHPIFYKICLKKDKFLILLNFLKNNYNIFY